MFGIISAFLAPILSIVLYSLGQAFFVTFITIRMNDLGYSDVSVGWVHGAFYAGLLLGAAKIEGVVRRVGHSRTLAAFASLLTASAILQGLYVGALPWIILRFIAGVSVAALYVSIESWLITTSGPGFRGTILAIYMAALYAAQALGQFFLDYLDLSSYEPYMISALFSSLCILPVALTQTIPPIPEEPNPLDIRKLLRESPFGVAGCLFSGVILGALYSFIPTYAQEQSFQVSMSVSACICGGWLLQWPVGKLSDRFDRRLVLLCLCWAMVVPLLALVMLPLSFSWALFFLFILGGIAFTLYPVAIAQVCDRVDEKDITLITGVLLLVYGIGSIIGPVGTSFFIHAFTGTALFGVLIGVVLTLAAIGIYSIRRRDPVPEEDQGPFQPLPNVSPVSYKLDPRRDQ